MLGIFGNYEMAMRIGHGYDVHRLSEGKSLILGGVKIPYHLGLVGHSDADVLSHAIIDALLGAAALGDIGKHFPDTDEKFKGVSSLELLQKVCGMIRDNGFQIQNIDSTIVAQSPKMAPFLPEMQKNIANACNIGVSLVSVKATTEEGLGFTGSGQGIAAHAVCLILND